MNAVTTPRALGDWINELVAAAGDADELRSVGVRAVDAGFARAEITCDRCQPREVFFFTGAVQHVRRSEEAYRRDAAGPPSLFALHQPGDLRPASPSDARGDRPIFWSTAQCGTCDAALIWAVTANGKRTPVDATPDRAGNVVLVDQGPFDSPLALVIHTEYEQATAPVDALHTSHFQTCAQASEWRKR